VHFSHIRDDTAAGRSPRALVFLRGVFGAAKGRMA
jgi:hypothetical protein